MKENSANTFTIRQNYDITFLADLLELIYSSCTIIYSDKELHRLFKAVIDYLDSRLPAVNGDIIDYELSLTVQKNG